MPTPVFVNPAHGRLRAGWRIAGFLVLFVGLAVLGQAILKALFGGIPQTTPHLRKAIVIGIAALAATIAVPLARRYLDKRSFVSLGLQLRPQAWKDLAFGFALSAAMAGAVFVLMLATGLVEFEGIVWGGPAEAGPFGSSLAVMGAATLTVLLVEVVIISWWEELVFRGYLLQNMMEGLGVWIAVGVSCLLYGLIHAGNPNATLLSSGIIVLFGFLRIYGYLATGMLWLSLGMHAGWNFFQGPILGYAASGNETATLVAITPSGPDWLSGGAFGPEASMLIVPILGLALLAMRWWSRRGVVLPDSASAPVLASV